VTTFHDYAGGFTCIGGFMLSGHDGHEGKRDKTSNVEISEDEKKIRIESLKKKAMSASAKFRNSMSKRGRRSSRVMSVSIEDVRDAEEMQVVDAFRQTLILEELLPSRHDDYHTMLRSLFNLIYNYLTRFTCFTEVIFITT